MSDKIVEYVIVFVVIAAFFGFIVAAYFNGKKNTEKQGSEKKNE